MAEHQKTEDIQKKVMMTIAELAGVGQEELTPATSLMHDLNLDSLALFEIVIELETFYNLRISDEEIEALKTIKEITDFIDEQLRRGKMPGIKES